MKKNKDDREESKLERVGRRIREQSQHMLNISKAIFVLVIIAFIIILFL